MFKLTLVLLMLIKYGVWSIEMDQMYFPDENGNLFVINLNQLILTNEDMILIKDESFPVDFTLYTNRAPSGVKLTINDQLSLQHGYWSPKKPTRIVTHGWQSHGNNPACQVIVDSYLKLGGYNVIVMDWSSVAKDVIYLRVSKRIPSVAKRITQLINWLIDEGNVDVSKVGCIGHSLGAHVVGMGASKAKSLIDMVVGLDPAGPGFEAAGSNERIDKSNAKNVQIIHTNAGRLGLAAQVGKSDFYPNGGTLQNGCGLDLLGTCSHSRSFMYYGESIINSTGFRATPAAFMYNKRSNYYAYMGGPVLDPKAVGRYELMTASQYPFALG